MSETTTRRRFLSQSAGVVGALAIAPCLAPGVVSGMMADPSLDALVDKAVAFLKGRQEANGGWSTTRKEPGITALVVTALLRSKRTTPAEPAITKGLAYLEQFIGPKGGLSEAAHANYSTSIALMAFHEANTGGKYDRTIKQGQDFLKSMQWGEATGKGRESDFYGGAGYGGNNSRPDLSNTAFFLDALRDTGLPADDPALKKALVFVSRCQNLKSEFNDQPWADKVNDGGFIYTAANGGQSMANEPGEKNALRSYASMTYAGLKSMIHAGLTPDDPRVKAAITYISKNYTLDENPGLGQKGLYYYYHTFARAMALLGKPTLTDSSGNVHDWRAELIAALAKRQSADGSWVNPADRFMEGDPNLVTSYGLLALAYTRAKG
jgi:squalene-hopene/tetraprenyl-beta-curcumene cyclase